MAPRLCIDQGPGCLTFTNGGTRCTNCVRRTEHQRDQHRGTTAQRGYDSTWRRLVTQAMDAQRAQRGHAWCVDCGITEGQASVAGNPLSGDHLHWPALTPADVEVCCRRCNSARGARRSGLFTPRYRYS